MISQQELNPTGEVTVKSFCVSVSLGDYESRSTSLLSLFLFLYQPGSTSTFFPTLNQQPCLQLPSMCI